MFFSATSLTQSSPGLGHRSEKKARGTTTSLKWSVDLRSVGFTGFAPKQEQWGLHFKANPLCFVSRETLIATFMTRENVTTLARRDQPGEALPLRLHGIFLDTEKGKVGATREWTITRPRAGIIAGDDGRFTVLTPAMIGVYSRNLELLKDLKLSSEQQSHLWNFYPSPTGKSIVVEYHHPEASFQWIDIDPLQVRAGWSDGVTGASISDDGIAFSRETFVKSTGFVHEVLLRPRAGSEQTICRVIVGRSDSCGVPEFLSADVLALWMPHGLTLVPKAGGDSILKATFREDEWLGRPLHPSADGKRFAVMVWAHKGGSEFLDISPYSALKRIVVYDLRSRQAIYTLDAGKAQIKSVSGAALSPDGSLLAILMGGVVEVYEIPSSTSAAPPETTRK